ncbi:MAG: AAA family ATPase [bacterium]|nr:AAA family ATPase [bacterium]
MIVLVGFMGSGKSSVGRALADRLGWDFADTDTLVEQREGCPVAEIFRRSSEKRFRELEREVLRSLEGRSNLVVAAGGGLYAAAGNRRRLRRLATTVWLDVLPEIARRRVGEGASRPLWEADPHGFRELFERRRATYALADVRVDASPGIDVVVESILGSLPPAEG